MEMSFEYWNKLADHIIFISSLLGGFSIVVVANLIIYKSKKRLVVYILKLATAATGCFLATVFAMTNIFMKTTQGYPMNVDGSDLTLPRIIGFGAFVLGIISLSIIISLAGWTKSKSTGIFTTIVGVLTFLSIITMLF